mmetsp:Transcript_24728/g.43565  ORF Transcript_24728/g.43565 Transcript_24728/m.43565 type:complete len:433 (-) Transcript_24728:533-1831(-)
MNRRLIALNYFKVWFWLDLAASFPYSWTTDGLFLEESSGSGENNAHNASSNTGMLSALKVLRFLRLFKMVRLAKLAKIMITIEDYISSYTLSSLLSIAKLIFPIIFIVHWTACIWYFVGDSEDTEHAVTWLNNKSLIPEDTTERYIAALYWTVTTVSTVGYGDIFPVTVNEKIYSSFIMILACGIFAFTLASVGGLITDQTAEARIYRRQSAKVSLFLKSKGVPDDLQAKAKRYLEYRWSVKKRRLDKDKEFISFLSEPLRDEINLCILGKVIVSYRLFRQFDKSFIAALTKQLKYEFFAPRDVVFNQGEVGEKIYFIKTGLVDLYDNISETTFNVVKNAAYFGEIAFLLDFVRCLSARTADYSELLSIDSIAFESVLERFPTACFKLKKILESCRGGSLRKIGVSCYCCKARGHVAVKCPELQLGLGEREA